MNFEEYTSDALFEILRFCTFHEKFDQYEDSIIAELKNRIAWHDHNVQVFAPYGVVPNPTKTKEDFLHVLKPHSQ